MHVPYRSSELTRVLQTVVGGNCITVVILNLLTTPCNSDASLTTLRFGAATYGVRVPIHHSLLRVELSDEQKVTELTGALTHVARCHAEEEAAKRRALARVAELEAALKVAHSGDWRIGFALSAIRLRTPCRVSSVPSYSVGVPFTLSPAF
jgi:hypothetical protein